MTITGKNFIGFSRSAATESHTFQAYVPAQATHLPEKFYAATPQEVDAAMQKGTQAFDTFATTSPAQRADFLMAITREIMVLGDELLQRAHLETGLPLPRLQGERARTIMQLTQFADLLREGSWVEASIDTAEPNRSPLPKPDIRKMLVPIGPIVVFGSSNFPFAYSVAGVDTAPALAAGNPVVVKAHPAHPGVSDLTAQAIQKAAEKTGMPDGVFSMLFDDGYIVGSALVKHPATKAVGFTGSQKGGMALYKMAMERSEPIPVFAEMGSVNPVVILPESLSADTNSLAQMLAASVTLGAGQFCTNPGLVFVVESPELEDFITLYSREISNVASTTMLTEGICNTFYQLKKEALAQNAVEILALSEIKSEEQNQSQATVARVSGKAFMANPALHEEVFGPYSLLVVCASIHELETALLLLKGQLTATLMATETEVARYPSILRILAQRAGRIVMNGVPTGVEVCPSMHHGGPFPATTDSRFTSVGRHSILRFVRPQSFQGWPNALLPDVLKNENPLGIRRLVNGQESLEAIDG
ncbi:aldehyde dehydrogenase (NADP(+)) [Arundinibacter roseus]|uniref:Aldehyde dehydrogenase (NADP(+)) n=1 Tax=Arundinibacter roseus TaxID=2070510 RepID=A0A4R4K5P6_9BACT|nr:aldehyde dehydrogenase (NADP(+)) [Arundinibacter roseus]TDB61846.1 aldehyde dehydrogenase (NADP(+)) [Arundinibacter roseus]